MATYKGTVASAQVSGTNHADFPLYIDLTAIKTLTQAEADSIRTYSDSGLVTEIPREIVSTEEAHTKSTSLNGSDDYFVDFDGIRSDYAVTATYGAENVWRSSYKGVWHLKDATDSTSNSNDGTVTGATSGATGKIGDGYSFDGADDYIDCGSPASTTTSEWTISAWVKPDDASTGTTTVAVGNGDTNNDGYHIRYRDSNFYILLGKVLISDPVAATVGSLQQIVITRRSGNLYLYKNGSENSLGTDTPNTPTDKTLIGAYNSDGSIAGYFPGIIDETRILNTAISSDWITTEYNNQNAPATFWTWEEFVAGGGTARRSHLMAM